MSKKSKFKIGVKYGIVKRILKRVRDRHRVHESKQIAEDLKHADEELIDFLCACTPETMDEFIGNINTWLSMEAKMTGYPATVYKVGQGENLFKKVGIERELYYRKQINS